jgi:hypothetical protein
MSDDLLEPSQDDDEVGIVGVDAPDEEELTEDMPDDDDDMDDDDEDDT